jgi:DNA-binding HxlR family transcriptional regulator
MSFAYRSECPIASALDIVGDKWTLLVLRMIFTGRQRYGEILKMPEGISTNILAERLELLHHHGLIARRAYQSRPARYEYRLTRKGADFLPVLQALAQWGRTHIPDRWVPPKSFTEATPAAFYPTAGG